MDQIPTTVSGLASQTHNWPFCILCNNILCYVLTQRAWIRESRGWKKCPKSRLTRNKIEIKMCGVNLKRLKSLRFKKSFVLPCTKKNSFLSINLYLFSFCVNAYSSKSAKCTTVMDVKYEKFLFLSKKWMWISFWISTFYILTLDKNSL